MKVVLFACLALALAAVLPVRAAFAAAGDVVRLQFGDVTILAISDAVGTAPVSLMPGLSREQRSQLVPSGSMRSFINVFVVITPDLVALVDTGTGEHGGALAALQAEGVTPDKVDLILLTHLHGDHVSGMLRDGAPLYPKAEVWLSEEEASYWTSDEFMLAQPREKQNAFFLARQVLDAYADRVNAFGPGQTIAPGIAPLFLPGHTAGHSGFVVESRGGNLFFWGDTMHFAEVQFAVPDVPVAYDEDGERAAATRVWLLNHLPEDRIPVAGAHLPFPGVGMVAERDGVFIFSPGLE